MFLEDRDFNYYIFKIFRVQVYKQISIVEGPASAISTQSSSLVVLFPWSSLL